LYFLHQQTMAKKILKLQQDREPDYRIVGISTGQKDYKLGHALNKTFNLNFIRIDDVELNTGRPGSYTVHTCLTSDGEDGEIYYIIANRDHSGTGFFIPEMREIDYFLLMAGITASFQMNELINRIRQIPAINGAYSIEHSTLKSVDAFLLIIES
jgi:hypothetical protein